MNFLNKFFQCLVCDHLLLNCITAKKFEILNSTITKTTCIMRNSTKKYMRHLNHFFLFLEWFELLRCQTPIFEASAQFLLRDFGSIFTFKTKLTCIFSVSGKFFAWELFLVAIYLYVFQINHKTVCSPDGCHDTK